MKLLAIAALGIALVGCGNNGANLAMIDSAQSTADDAMEAAKKAQLVAQQATQEVEAMKQKVALLEFEVSSLRSQSRVSEMRAAEEAIRASRRPVMGFPSN